MVSWQNYTLNVSNPSFESLLETIRQRVETRRRAGEYPPGLEESLEYEFAEMVRRHADRDMTVDELKDLVLSRLAIVDHLAMMVVELEDRIARLESPVHD